MIRQYFIPYVTLNHRYLFGISFTNKSREQGAYVSLRFESGDSDRGPILVNNLWVGPRKIIKSFVRDWGVTWSQYHEDWLADLTMIGGEMYPNAFIVDRAGGSTTFVDVIRVVATLRNIIVPVDGKSSWMVVDDNWEYIGNQVHCQYSRAIDAQILQILFKIIKLRFGVKIIILEGSSVDGSPCGHFNNAHTYLRSIDLQYPFKEDGNLNITVIAYLLSMATRVWPKMQIIVGIALEQELSTILSREELHRIVFDDGYDHKVDRNNPRSHMHFGINGSEVNLDVVLGT